MKPPQKLNAKILSPNFQNIIGRITLFKLIFSFFFIGFVNCMSIQKCIAQDPQWANTYPDDKYSNATFYATDTTIDSNIIAVGTTIIDDKRYVLIAKISYEGDTIWTRNLNTEFEAEGRAIKCWSEGFIIVGTAFIYENNSDLLMVSVDLDGEIIWFKNFEIDGNQVGYGVLKSSSNFIACGYNEEDTENRQLLVLKTDINGDPVWINSYGNEDAAETGYSMCLRNDGEGVGYYIAGSISNEEAATDSIYTIFLAANGDIIKQKNYGIGTSTFGYSVVHSKAGGFIIAGKTKVDSHFDAAVIKINENDSVLFTNNYGGDYDDIVYAVAEHNDGSLFFTGTTNSFEDRDHTDIYIMRTDNWGDTLHSWVIDNGFADGAYGTFLKNDSNLIAVGFSASAEKNEPWAMFINTSCGHWNKRTLWINNLWCLEDCGSSQTTCFTNNILSNGNPPTTETQKIVDYLNLMKIRKVIIGRAFDLMCEDMANTNVVSPYPYSTNSSYNSLTSNNSISVSGSTMRARLALFIQQIKTNAHVEEVYVVLRSATDESALENAADPLKYNYLMIEGIKAYNIAQPTQLTRLDGIFIDYEYASPVYGWDGGIAANQCNPFYYSRPGWEAFTYLIPDVGTLINHGNNIYGLNKFGIYFTGFDVKYLSKIPAAPCVSFAPAPPIFAANVLIDKQDVADFIEDPANNIDFIECEMFLNDETTSSNFANSTRPDKWYYGGASANYFYNQLYHFGNNSNAVTLIPALDFKNSFTNSSGFNGGHLGDFAKGVNNWSSANTNCPNPGPHYVPEIENDFYNQFASWFNDYIPTDPYTNNYLVCISPLPLSGIDLFRSELDPLNKCYYDNFSRYPDSRANYAIYGPHCPLPDRYANNFFDNPSDEKINVSIFPNPVNSEFTVKTLNSVLITHVIIFSTTGHVIKEIEPNSPSSEINITNIKLVSAGIYFIKVATEKETYYSKIIKL